MSSTSTPSTERSGESPFALERRNPPELDGMVERFIGYREYGQAIAGNVEMAALVVPLVISFGDAFEIGLGHEPGSDDRYDSFTSGLYAGPVLIASNGAAECIQINFTPLGAWRFFGLPMNELAARMVTLDDLGDREMRHLRQRLWEERDWGRRLDLAEGFVLERFRRARQADPAVHWAYERMLSCRGDLRISDVARKLEWSRKHLSQRFQAQLGLPPKTVARMIRFHAALAMARGETRADWADIAAACGYADQAHLTREFSEFAGASPARWLSQAA
ncbi:helix-turn-helix domain-containing protein [Rhizobiaceae sp. 2RAB30]